MPVYFCWNILSVGDFGNQLEESWVCINGTNQHIYCAGIWEEGESFPKKQNLICFLFSIIQQGGNNANAHPTPRSDGVMTQCNNTFNS